jgi:hypothetical protein
MMATEATSENLATTSISPDHELVSGGVAVDDIFTLLICARTHPKPPSKMSPSRNLS